MFEGCWRLDLPLPGGGTGGRRVPLSLLRWPFALRPYLGAHAFRNSCASPGVRTGALVRFLERCALVHAACQQEGVEGA